MRCEQAGIAKKNCCSTRDSVSVKSLPQLPTVGGLGEFHHFGLPLLVGMSRKSMVGQLLNVGPSERLNGSWRVPSLQQCRARRLSASMMSKKR
nr:Dihydropteroate synthase [Klebsiella pneumoniae]